MNLCFIRLGTSTSCPESHPFSFANGAKCCKYPMEWFNGVGSSNCDSTYLGSGSACCYSDKFIACGGNKCGDAKSEESAREA